MGGNEIISNSYPLPNRGGMKTFWSYKVQCILKLYFSFQGLAVNLAKISLIKEVEDLPL